MTKQSGLGDALWLDGFDMSGDTNSIGNIHGGPAPLDVTGIDKSGMERIGGIRESSLEWTSYFNPGIAADDAHTVYKALPTSQRIAVYSRGTSLSSPAAGIQLLQANYDGKRGNDGAFTFDLTGSGTGGTGLEWGILGTAGKRADTTATNGTAIDYGATIGSTAFGLSAYLQVFAFTGTSCTVKIQESSDNGGADAFADVTGGSFGAQTAVGAVRLRTSTTLTVERYLRVVTTGTFSACTFAVVLVKHQTAVAA